MPDIYLDVPFVTQLNIGGHVPGAVTRDETTGCWYAAICMVAYYREEGPRRGVPTLYANGSPTGNPSRLGGENYDQMVANEGLVPIPLPASKTWTCEVLAGILRDCGPCYIRRGFVQANGTLSGGHAIVLVGAKTSSNKVVCHDPWLGPNRKYSIHEFNSFFKWSDSRAALNSMMVKLPPAENGEIRQRANAMSTSPPTRPRSNAVITPRPQAPRLGGHRG